MTAEVTRLHEVEAELVPLYQGTIWRLFEWKPPMVKPQFDHRALPQVGSQCVHVSCTYIDLPDGSQLVVDAKRCVKDAEVGFLCEKHDWVLLSQPVTKRSKAPERDFDQEVVEGIILHEQRELTNLQVNERLEVQKIGKMRFTTIKDFVGKALNPKDYNEFDGDGLEEPINN